MKKDLLNILTKTLESNKSVEEKSLTLISLAEEAFDYGDIRTYSLIIDKVKELNPTAFLSKNTQMFKNVDRNKKGTIPDIEINTYENK